MRALSTAVVGSSVVFALLSTAPSASAEEPVAVRIRVVAAEDCASDVTFWAAVTRHTSRLQEDQGGALVELAIGRQDEDHVVGVLEVAPPGEMPWQRRLTGGSCAEVTDGLALVTALAFDPNATVEPVVAPAAPEPAVPRVIVSPERAPREAPIAGVPAREARWRGAVLASIGPLALGTSSAVVGYGIAGDLERDRSGLAPSFRLALTHAEGSVGSFGPGADLAWTTGRASVCPLRADLASTVSLRPCAGLDLGVLVSTPVNLDRGASVTRAWVNPLLSGRIRWLVFPVLFVEGEAGIATPLVRDELAADPSITLYRAPGVIPLASLSVGVRFP